MNPYYKIRREVVGEVAVGPLRTNSPWCRKEGVMPIALDYRR